MLPSGNEFITCGEDRSVRVWDATDGRCVQNMVMPCQSVWCIAALSNGDFAVGGNDAMIRIFTRSPDRTAPDTELQVFSEQVSRFPNAILFAMVIMKKYLEFFCFIQVLCEVFRPHCLQI